MFEEGRNGSDWGVSAIIQKHNFGIESLLA